MCGIISGIFLSEDTFADKLRKLNMTIALWSGCAALCVSTPLTLMEFLDGVSWLDISHLVYGLTGSTGILHWAYARKHKTVSNTQIISLMVMAYSCVTIHTFSTPQGHDYFHCWLLTMMVWLMDMKPRLPFLLWMCALNLVAIWNKSCMETRDDKHLAWMLVIPGAQVSGSLGLHLLGWTVAWATFAAAGLVAIHFQSGAYQSSIRRANFSNEVVNLMLEKIKSFDIESARQVLAESEQEIDETTKEKVLNPEFGGTLGSLCDQLDSYRPYLPNWLLMARDAESGDQERDLSDIDQGSNLEETAVEEISQGFDNHSASSSNTSNHSVLLTANPMTANSMKPAVKTQREKCLRRITLCVLDFEPKRGKLRKEPAYLDMVQTVIDAVAKAAKITHASIHGTTGDQIVVSWNASVKSVQPALKACQFLCQVKAQLREYHRDTYDSLGFSGAAKTGLAWCHHVVSTTGSKSSNFMIHYLWRSALEAMCRHARAFGTLLVDEQTFDLGQLRVEGWLVDALKLDRELLPSGERVESYSSIVDPQRPQPQSNSFVDRNTSEPMSPTSPIGLPGYQPAGGSETPSENNSLHSSVNLDLAGPETTMVLSNPSKVVEGHKDTKDSVMLCYELLQEKSLAEDEWLYQLEEAAAAPHENVSALAKRLWCPAPASMTEGTTPRQTHESTPSMVAQVQEAMNSGKVTNTLLLRRFYQHAQNSVSAWTEEGKGISRPQSTAVRKGNRRSTTRSQLEASSRATTPEISSLVTSPKVLTPHDVYLS